VTTRFVGVDAGTLMIKAGATASAGEAASPLALAMPQPGYPVAARRALGEPGFQVGWPAFRVRRRHALETAVGFRDRLLGPESELLLGNRGWEGLKVQTALWADVGKALLAAAPDMTALAVTVPDTWAAPRWSLPMALRRAGWSPLVLVREWCAALAAQALPPGDECVALSLGRGSARASLCVAGNGRWEAAAVAEAQDVSGQMLHRALADCVAEDIIRQTRRDPREDPEADQALADAVDAAWISLQRNEAAAIRLSVYGSEFSRRLTSDDLVSLVPSYPEKIESLVRGLLGRSPSRLSACPVVVWGELSELLPIAEWLSRATPSHLPARASRSEILALGAARLAALAHEGELFSAISPGTAVSLEDGSPCRGMFADDARFVRLLDAIPTTVAPAQPRRRAFVARADRQDEPRREILSARFRIGRHPDSEYAFDAEGDLTVSSAHAVILREGADYFLSDLGSTNGTFVNDNRLGKSRRALRHGDLIRLGASGPTLLFELEE
jgi:hypothetical protein